jgi:hypothetical protein
VLLLLVLFLQAVASWLLGRAALVLVLVLLLLPVVPVSLLLLPLLVVLACVLCSWHSVQGCCCHMRRSS